MKRIAKTPTVASSGAGAHPKRPRPAYQQIADDIRSKVLDGRLPAGAMLASRPKLAKEYGVALSTAQQAIASLLADGTLNTLDRRGTFVSHPGEETRAPLPISVPPALPPLRGASVPLAPLTSASTTATLGIIATALIDQAASPDVGSLWARQAIRSLEEVLSAAGGTTIFFDRYPASGGPYERGIDDPRAISMTEAIHTLTARGVDALAIVGLCDGRDVSDEIVAAVDIDKVPVVYLSWHEMHPPVAQVFYDNRYAGYQAAQHLLRRGYERLLFVAPFQEPWLMERIEGARDAVRHAGLPPLNLQIFPAKPQGDAYVIDHVAQVAYDAARDAFAHYHVFPQTGILTAEALWGIIAPNDFTAFSILRAATEAGATVGSDYGLIGFDDDPMAFTVGLTTVRPPIEAMGEEAGRLLLRALAGGEARGLQMRLRSQIIPRASTIRGPGATK